MSDQYVGEIRMFSGNYPPQGWAFCNGQLLSIGGDYDTLYSLIGTTYGGDGQTTFALPDLRGRLPIHLGTDANANLTYKLGDRGGVEQVTLVADQLPSHTHAVNASSLPGTATSPSNAYFAVSASNQYSDAAPNGTMNPGAISAVGGNEAHNNVMPIFAVSFIIALQGNYPNQS